MGGGIVGWPWAVREGLTENENPGGAGGVRGRTPGHHPSCAIWTLAEEASGLEVAPLSCLSGRPGSVCSAFDSGHLRGHQTKTSDPLAREVTPAKEMTPGAAGWFPTQQ